MSSKARPPARSEPADPDPLVGRTLAGRYLIGTLIARGGMARVYRAHDERLDRDVAVKVLAAPYRDDAAFTEQFLGEARAAASISHPSIAHVYDSGSDGDAHYIVMELLDQHRTLRSILEERGPLPAPDVIRIGSELLEGLRAVHDRDLVHCDVKAANVMLGPGPAKLIDFGIARKPDSGVESETSIGTLQAMSPEQLHGERLTPASDLFSLGTVLYEALTGKVPFPGRTPDEVSAAQRAGPPVAPSAQLGAPPSRLDDVILQSLRREPASRFRTAEAMARALEVVAVETTVVGEDETRLMPAPRRADEPVDARPLEPVPSSAGVAGRAGPPRRPAHRRPAGWTNVAATLAVLAAAGLVIVLVVVPLLDLPNRANGGGGAATPAPSAAPATSTAPAGPTIPNVVGLPTNEAIALARDAGLNWRLECAHDESRPEGIIDQEPPAGTPVEPGARFTMYSARIEDCR